MAADGTLRRSPAGGMATGMRMWPFGWSPVCCCFTAEQLSTLQVPEHKLKGVVRCQRLLGRV